MTNEGTSAIIEPVTTVVRELSTVDAIIFLLSGFGVVMITLALLWLVTSITGLLLKKLGLDKMPAPKAKAKPFTIQPEVIAVITAAVSFATGGQAAIREINRKS
jgi:Na+-transporting methylmalonyl-CoA/oxaloacetate decarboxylase gamma subunit